MNTQDPLRLQALFDEEVPRDEADALRDSLCAEDKLRLQALEELQLLTKTRATQEADEVDLSGMWSRIEAHLDAPARAQASLPSPAQVPPAPVASASTSGASGSWIDKLAALLGLDRRVVVPLFAVAAVVLLIMIPQMMNRRPQAPPTNPSINPAPSAATNNHQTNPPLTKTTPATPDPASQGDPPQIIVIFNPSSDQPNQDWLVKYPRPQTPVIWYTGNESEPNAGTPNALPPALWPAVQEAIKDIQNRATPPQNNPTNNPTNGPI